MKEVGKYGISKHLSVAVFLTAISCSLLLILPNSNTSSVVNVLISLLLLPFPESYIPLIFASSVSRSISIFGFSATYYYAIVLLFYVSIKSKFRFSKNNGKSWNYLRTFLVWLLICSLFSVTDTMTIFVRIVIVIFLCHLCASTKILGINESLYFLKKTAPIILTIILAKLLVSPVPYVIEGNYTILVLNSVSESINPNQLAQLIATILFLSVTTLKDNNKILSIVCIVFSILILFLLKSRTSLYAALAISAFYFLFVLYRVKFKYRLLIFCCAIFFVVLQLLTAIQLDPTETTTHGESKGMDVASLVESGGSGRIFMWQEVISDVIPKHPIKGIGLGTENYEAIGYEHDCDNLFLDLIAETGFVGFFLFFMFFIKTALKINQENNTTGTIIKYLLYLILFLGIGETLFDALFMWSIVFLCYIYMFSNKQSYQYGKMY